MAGTADGANGETGRATSPHGFSTAGFDQGGDHAGAVSRRIVFIAMAIGAGFLAATLSWHRLERQEADALARGANSRQQSLIHQLIDTRGASLDVLARDYSCWDDMVAFLRTGSTRWAGLNINTSLLTYDADGMWVLRPDFGQAYSATSPDARSLSGLPLSPERIRRAFAGTQFCHFYLNTRCGLLEVRGAAIHKTADTQRTGPGYGYLLAGRIWDAGYLNEIARVTRCKVSLSAPLARWGSRGDVAFSIPLAGPERVAAARLDVQGDLPLLRLLAESSSRSLALVLSYALLLILLLALAMHRFVSEPLSVISAGLRNRDIRLLRTLADRPTEFGDLARLAHSYFEQEQELRVSEERFRALVEYGPNLILVLDSEGFIRYVTPSVSRVLGYAPEELIGQRVFDGFVHPDDLPQALTEFQKRLTDGHDPQPVVYRARGKDGAWHWMEATGTRAVDLAGVSGMVVSVRDITETRLAEDRLERLLTNLGGLVWEAEVHAEDGDYCWDLFVPDEEAAQRFLPVRREPGQSFVDAWTGSRPPDDETRSHQASAAAFREGRPYYSNEYRCLRSDGQYQWIAETARIQPIGPDRWQVSGVCVDITERKAAEEALCESEARMKLALKAGRLAISDWDLRTGDYVMTQFVAPELEGYATPVLMTRAMAESRVHPDDLPAFQDAVRKGIANKSEYRAEFRYLHSDGRLRWHETQGVIYCDADGEPVRALGIITDVTERRAARERIRRQVDQLTALRAVDSAIAASLDMRLSLSIVIEQVTGRLGADAAIILLCNPESQILEYAAGRGFRGAAPSDLRVRLGVGLAGRAALERTALKMADVDSHGDPVVRHAALKAEGFADGYAVPLVAKGQVKGALVVLNRSQLVFDPEQCEFLDLLAGQAAIAIDSAAMFGSLQHSNTELLLAYDQTIEGWCRALDLRDREKEGHSIRVTDTTVRLGRAMGMSEADLVHVRRGAMLHDVGKMGVPDSILLKPGPLSEFEWSIVRRHPIYAYDLLSPIAFLRPAMDIPRYHHEKWDGTGYPEGLRGDTIPLPARLFAVAEVWDALRSDRPYRAAWEDEEARQHIASLAGSQFDPAVVAAFMELLRESEAQRWAA